MDGSELQTLLEVLKHMLVLHVDATSAEELALGGRCAAEVLLQTMPGLLEVRAAALRGGAW